MYISFDDENLTFVSNETPLLSNLSIVENISLISQIKENSGYKHSIAIALKGLKALNLEHISHLRYSDCSQKEVFFIQLIRANILKDVKIIIDRPFNLVSEAEDMGFIHKTLELLEIPFEKVIIIDLRSQESYYKEKSCQISN